MNKQTLGVIAEIGAPFPGSARCLSTTLILDATEAPEAEKQSRFMLTQLHRQWMDYCRAQAESAKERHKRSPYLKLDLATLQYYGFAMQTPRYNGWYRMSVHFYIQDPEGNELCPTFEK